MVDLDVDDGMARVRDYVGSSPDDNTIYTLADTSTYWQEVALRILLQRRADLAKGDGLTSLNLGGDVALGFKAADLAAISASIRDLQKQIADLNGTPTAPSVYQIKRPDRVGR